MNTSNLITRRLAQAALLLCCPLLLAGTLHASNGDGKGQSKLTKKEAQALADSQTMLPDNVVVVSLTNQAATDFLGFDGGHGFYCGIYVYYLIHEDGSLEYLFYEKWVIGPTI